MTRRDFLLSLPELVNSDFFEKSLLTPNIKALKLSVAKIQQNISLQIAVDMTKSNGNSSYEKSLHRITPEMKEDPEHEGWKKNMYY